MDKEEKRRKCEVQAKFSLTCCSVPSLFLQLMKYSCSLTHDWDPLSFSNVSLERVSIKKAVNLVDSYMWGLSYRSEVKTRDAWNILCLKGLCMEGHRYKKEEKKGNEILLITGVLTVVDL